MLSLPKAPEMVAVRATFPDEAEALVDRVDDLAEAKPKVLVVDDQPANLVALEATLADLDLDLVKAASGFEALRCLLHGDFALILMDVKMPHMDGFETAELIRGRKRCQHMPIIFMTAFESGDAQIFKGYALGAVDYLQKPIVAEVLRSKVAVFVDIYRKTEQIKRQGDQLRLMEQRAHERRLEEARASWEAERLHQEIHIARRIQQKLFPAAPLPLPGIDIAGASFPAEATGGDYFDYIPMQDGGVAVVIGDVSGHGFGPALLMAQLRAYLRAFLLTRTDVGDIVGLVNRAVAADMDDRFATLLVAKLDPSNRSFVYASAGHLPGYLLNAAGEVTARLESTGIPLAIMPEAEYAPEPARTLHSGDLILLLTDGIVEARDTNEQLFGSDRVLDLVRTHRDRPAREILNILYTAVRDFCGPPAQVDDMTAVIIKAE
jgi:sigma-B regulation protein RsbU (phosphoserine phosphatase)